MKAVRSSSAAAPRVASASRSRSPRSKRLPDATFPKRERLRKRAEYLDVQRAGRKVQTDHFLLLWQTQRDASPPAVRSRVGITVSSRVGNAVVRNRCKRWVRDFVRHHKLQLPAGDLVIIAKPSAATLGHDMLDRDLKRLLGRAVRP